MSERMKMEPYLVKNYEYYEDGYEAENVESFVFRVYGRIFKAELGMDGTKREKLLDFGCGSGAALRFFKSKGFDVYGVDISPVDIERCKQRMPDIQDHFSAIDPEPKREKIFWSGGYDVIISIQTLYFLSIRDQEVLINCLYNQMKKGAIFYVSMIGTKCWYYKHSVAYKDGLRKVSIAGSRLKIKECYLNFIESEQELSQRFKMFKKLHIGYYDAKYREDEGSDFHYTFIGRKE